MDMVEIYHGSNVKVEWPKTQITGSREDYAHAILRVYNNPICEIIDDYNCSAYYEPSPFIARSYYAGSFN